MAHRVCQGWHIPTYDSCHNRPSEAHCSGYAISKLRSPAPRLHRVVHDMPSPMAGLVAIGGISISFFVGRDVFMLEMGQKNKKRRNLCCFRFVEKTNGEVALLGMW